MMKAIKSSRGHLAAIAVAGGWGVICSAYAQVVPTDGASPPVLQEVIVTAQKRAQNLQDVGISITALSGAQVAQLGLVNTTDIAQRVPNLQTQNVGSFYTIFDLRGVSQNDFAAYEEAPVAVYSDGAYRAVLGELAGSLFDLKTVEVDRGPQGTLFGRNATGGLIQYISNKPGDHFEGYLEGTAGNFGEIDSQGAISGPLTSWLDARLSFATNYNTGYVERVGGGPRLGDQKLYQGRLQFLFKLSDDLNVLVKLHGLSNPHLNGTGYHLENSFPDPVTGLGSVVPPNVNLWGPYFAQQSAAFGFPGIFSAFPSCPGCGPVGIKNTGSNPFVYDLNGYSEDYHRQLYGATVHVNWNMGHGMALTSITDFLHFDFQYRDAEGASVILFNAWQSFRQFSQELNLSGDNGPLRWVTGLYFLDMNSKDYSTSPFPPTSPFGTSALGIGLLGDPGNIYDVKTFSEAAYAQADWSFTDSLTATFGARISRDEKINSYALYDGGGLLYGGTPFPGYPAAGVAPDLVFDRATSPLADLVNTLPSWKAELDYKPARDALLYVSVNRGIKSGGFNEFGVTALPIPTSALTFRPEALTDYELGEKLTFWGGRARLNSGVFFYDYRNYQSFALVGGTTAAVQNYDARDRGGELELSLLPASGLEFQLGVSGLAARVQNVVLPTGMVVASRMMPLAPKWTVNSLLRYSWHGWHSSSWWVQVDAKWNTYEYFETYNSPTDYQPAYMVANASIGYTDPTGKLDVRLFCNNVGDKLYQSFNADTAGLGFGAQIFAMPRTYGGTLTYHF